MGCTFFTSFLCHSCNLQYFILGWPTLVLGPSYVHEHVHEADLIPQGGKRVSGGSHIPVRPKGRKRSLSENWLEHKPHTTVDNGERNV